MYGAEMLRPGAAGGKTGKQAREKQKREKISLKKWLWETLPWCLCFFLFSLAQCLSVPSPYAVCCLMAALACRIPATGIYLGLTAGLLFRLGWGLPLDIWQFTACLCGAFAVHLPWRTDKQLYGITLGVLLLRMLPIALTAQDTQTVLLAGIGLMLGMISMPALLRSIRFLQKRQAAWSQDDLLCLLLPALLLITGAARLHAFGLNIGYMASVLVVLYLSRISGGAAAICTGLGCGLSLLLGGQSALLLVILAFGGLVAGMFQSRMRVFAALAFLLSAAVLTYLIAFAFHPLFFGAACFSCLCFVMTPQKWLRRMTLTVRRMENGPPRDNPYIRMKMQRWVRSIDRMAGALPQPRIDQPGKTEESQNLSEQLCTGCDRMPICWHEKYEETKGAMEALVNRDGSDPESYVPLINAHFSACPRISRLPKLLEKQDEERQSRSHRSLCADYERDMLQTHLTALSQAAQRISLEGMQTDAEEKERLALTEEALSALRFPGKAAFVKRIDGHWTVCLQSDGLFLRPASAQALAKQIGMYLNVPLEITEQKHGRILLEEQPPLTVHTGIATACAVTLENRGQTEAHNGDAVLTQSLDGGMTLLALSDGMGHGKGAQEESKKTLEMLSLCMAAGYSRSQAMTAVNGAMLSATGGEKFATVDLVLIDLWTGDAVLNKMGACASILMQGQRLQWIEGEALPLGIIEHVKPMEHPVRLAEGDWLLLMSDGVTDAFDTPEDILEIVKRQRLETPQHAADALLKEALTQRDGLPPDDMTVLCAKVMERKKQKP